MHPRTLKEEDVSLPASTRQSVHFLCSVDYSPQLEQRLQPQLAIATRRTSKKGDNRLQSLPTNNGLQTQPAVLGHDLHRFRGTPISPNHRLQPLLFYPHLGKKAGTPTEIRPDPGREEASRTKCRRPTPVLRRRNQRRSQPDGGARCAGGRAQGEQGQPDFTPYQVPETEYLAETD